MIARFICPHCHASVNPHAMERAYSDLAEYRICPACDEPVFFALRDAPCIPQWLQRPDSGDDAPSDAGTTSAAPSSHPLAADMRPGCQ